MKVIEADISYVKQIVDIESSSFSSDKWNEEQWNNEFTINEFAHILLLLDEEKVVGYIDYWILFEQATISKMCVIKEYRIVD